MIKTVPKIIAAATGLVLAMGALVVMTGAREKHEERYNAYMTHFVNPVVEKYDLSNDTEPRSPYDYITVDNGSRIVGMLEFLVPKKYNDEFVDLLYAQHGCFAYPGNERRTRVEKRID